ncbi:MULTISPECIES: hypothetical protein [Bacteria]|uniref:hypothetical protein n=1 Tax=Pseudomonadati TaxID=3379134 RepID=UPI00326720BA
MATIDLTELTRNEVRSLIGYERGERARDYFELGKLDRGVESIRVTAPANLRTLTPSFVQGFLGNSILSLGLEAFRNHYLFDGFSALQIQSIETGIDRVLMKRSFETTAA